MTHSSRYVDYLYILATIVLTVYGQVVLKMRMTVFGEMPVGVLAKGRFFIAVLTDPLIFSTFAAAFLASIAWIIVLTRFELSYAYPFTSLNFIIVLVLSVILMQETMSFQKLVGVLFIVLGTLIAARA